MTSVEQTPNTTAFWEAISANLFIFLIAGIVLQVLSLMMTPLILSRLGPAQFAMMSLSLSVAGQFGLMDLGISQVLVRRASELVAQNDIKELERVVSTFLAAGALAAFLVGVGGYLSAPSLVAAFNPPKDSIGVFTILLRIAMLQVALSFPTSVWTGIVSGLQRNYDNSAISVTTSAVRTIGTAVLLLHDQGVVTIVILNLICSVLSAGMTARYSVVSLPQMKLGFAYVDIAILRDSWRGAGAMFIWSLAGRAHMDLGRLIVGLISPLSTVATFEVALRLYSQARVLLNSTVTIIPAAIAAQSSGDEARVRSLYFRGTRFLALAHGLLLIGTLSYGREFLRLWLGEDYTAATLPMVLLFSCTFMQSFSAMLHISLVALKDDRAVTLFSGGYIIASALFCFLFTQWFGAAGAALGTLTAVVVVDVATMLLFLPRIGVRLGPLIKSCLCGLLPAFAVATVAAIILQQTVGHASWTALAISASLTVALGVSAALLSLSRQERHLIWMVLVTRLLRIPAPSPNRG